ncbi:MAG: DUF1569 domain-containing protein [Ignavibacteriae bacterium]|nr:DUF1569 domain-containing protein [Ignavibacteriota bacterium]
MKNIFNESDKLELIERINKLTPDTRPEWGKMNASQMLDHCTVSVKLALGEIKPEINEENLRLGRVVKGRIFESDVFSKELPTTKEFIVLDNKNFDLNKRTFIDYVNRFGECDPNNEINGMHPYFGVLTMKEWSMLIWKHTNHHLIQFGV